MDKEVHAVKDCVVRSQNKVTVQDEPLSQFFSCIKCDVLEVCRAFPLPLSDEKGCDNDWMINLVDDAGGASFSGDMAELGNAPNSKEMSS